ncbi:MAG: winged helix-turn-helix domain-containing protein, partial [Kiloniellales bacterium]
MAALRIRLLGGFEVSYGPDATISLTGRKTQALLAYLALPPGEPRAREKLTALLWSDRGEEQARSSLRQALSELRKALGDADPPPLIAGRDVVSLDADAVDVDAVAFERLIGEATPEALAQAVEIYQGELLDGLGVDDPAFEEWLRAERQ